MAIIHESLSIPSRNIYVVSTQSYPSNVTHNCIWPAREPSGFQEDHYPQSRPSSYFQSTHPVKTQRSWRITDTTFFQNFVNESGIKRVTLFPGKHRVFSYLCSTQASLKCSPRSLKCSPPKMGVVKCSTQSISQENTIRFEENTIHFKENTINFKENTINFKENIIIFEENTINFWENTLQLSNISKSNCVPIRRTL